MGIVPIAVVDVVLILLLLLLLCQYDYPSVHLGFLFAATVIIMVFLAIHFFAPPLARDEITMHCR